MRNVFLIRKTTGKFGTFGRIYFEDFQSFTCEPPWKDNRPRVSCIPVGTYVMIPYKSNKFGNTYLVKDVEGRSWILSHSGNVGGDMELGLRTDTLGCILQGKYLGKVFGQLAVCLSRPTLRRFLEKAKGEKLNLIVAEAF